MDKQNIKLTFSDNSCLESAALKAMLFENTIELVFSQNNKIITSANLAPDKASFSKTLVAIKAKINLICKRLGIHESQLIYDRTSVSIFKKIIYKPLILLKYICSILIPVQWVIVFKHQHDNKWRKIIPDSHLFQADPFVVYKNDKYFIFYEELKFEDYHGYLKVAELDSENGTLINDQIILKLEHHLSYPNVFEEKGIFYMIPECADSNRVDLFECTEFPYQWQKKQTLIENISAVDTTPLKTKEGTWYLFTSVITEGAVCGDELSIYTSTNLLEQAFTKLYEHPVLSDISNARMAGHFIQRGDEIIRVSQDCGKRYGFQTKLNRVLQIEESYKEEIIETIKPSQGALGFHTYNQAHELIVGDMEIARFDWRSLKRLYGSYFKRLFDMGKKTFVQNK